MAAESKGHRGKLSLQRFTGSFEQTTTKPFTLRPGRGGLKAGAVTHT